MSSKRGTSGGLGYCKWPSLEPNDMSQSLSRRWYIQMPGQSVLCSVCGCIHLQFFILRDLCQCCPSLGRESLACPPLGREALYWQLSRGERLFFFKCCSAFVASGLHTGMASGPNARVTATLRGLPWTHSSSSAAGFGVDHFCAHKPVTLVPCFTFPDPV